MSIDVLAQWMLILLLVLLLLLAIDALILIMQVTLLDYLDVLLDLILNKHYLLRVLSIDLWLVLVL